MADGRDWLARIGHCDAHFEHLRVAAHVGGREAARQDERVVLGRINRIDLEIRFHRIAVLARILLTGGGGADDDDLGTLLLQS